MFDPAWAALLGLSVRRHATDRRLVGPVEDDDREVADDRDQDLPRVSESRE